MACLAALTVVALVSALIGDQTDHAFVGLFAAAVLLASLRRFFLPTHYLLDAAGVSATMLTTRRLAWSRVRRLAADQHGVYFGPRSQASCWDAFLGLHVAFGRHRSEVLAWLREFSPISVAPRDVR